MPFWLEGGWGVDDLVGHQTRAHRDVDMYLDADLLETVLDALAFAALPHRDRLATHRVELVAASRCWADLNPVQIGRIAPVEQSAKPALRRHLATLDRLV